MNRTDSNDLAIVGCAFRFPGASSRKALWQALMGRRDLVTRVAPDRWAQDALLHPLKSEPGTSYTFAAGSLGDLAGFDAAFFGISPREALEMDPQQRLLLELAWETFEDAGIPPSQLQGSRCGVFVGVSATDYAYRLADDLAAIDATTMTGNTASIAANRLSYVFDLRGPSMAVDTACSSSLVAFHQACLSILAGESSAALVGGIGLHLHPFGFIGFSKASMMSRRGRCAPFDAQGDGYVRSEGGALVLVKRLRDALAQGDRILAVVLGSALNSDGRTQGLTVPSPMAQAQLLSGIYARCGVAPEDLDYVEAHGTGTAVGDPIEAQALGDALGRHRPADRPLLIGSVKSNIGHLEVAAGMAGLVKALLCLEHRTIPPTIHLETPNPAIDFEAWNLRPVVAATPLDASRRLVIGVNSFGFGGANAHVVLGSVEAPRVGQEASPAGEPSGGATDDPRPAQPPPLLLSARSAPALTALARALAEQLRARSDQDLYDIAAALAMRREVMPYRLAAYADGREAMAEVLERFAEGATPPGLVTGRLLARPQGPVFVFAGNGSQWVGMGRALLQQDASFRTAVEAVDALFSPAGGFSILAELSAPEGDPRSAERLAATEVAQPLLFAVQVGLTRMLADRGMVPAAVVGHSVGEVAAAWACGALSLSQAVQVIRERSRHQGHTRGSGEMTAVALSEVDVRHLLEAAGLAATLHVAGINSARSVTLAGPAEALATCEAALSARGVRFRRLALDYAFHGPAMEPIRDGLLADLAGLVPGEGMVPFYSTVSGSVVGGASLDAGYWWRNVREPVQFRAAVEGLLEAGFSAYLEIGPSPILRGYLKEAIKDRGVEAEVLPTLTPDQSDLAQIDRVFHQLLLSGVPFEWSRLFPRRGRFVDLPTYPWQRERFWRASTSEQCGLIARVKEHPLLGYRLRETPLHWENHLDTSLYPHLADHKVGGAVVFPAAAYVEMALAAAALWQPDHGCDVEGLEIAAPLLLEDNRSRTVRFQIDPRDGGFLIRSRVRLSDDPWLVHVAGRLTLAAGSLPLGSAPAVPATPPDAPAELHYRRTAALGLDYGPAFRSVQGVWVAPEEAVAILATPAAVATDVAEARLHPAYLDGAFQVLADLLAGRGMDASPPAYVPIRVERLRLIRAGSRVEWVRARLRRAGRRSVLVDFALYDRDGQPVALAEQTRFRALPLRRPAAELVRQIEMTAIPRPRLRDTERSVMIPVGDLAALAVERLHEPARIACRDRYLGEVEPLLDVLCAAFARQALLALDPQGAGIDPADWLSAGTVAACCEPLLLHLLQILTEDELLERVGRRWTWRDDATLPEARDIWTSLMGDYPDHAGLIGLAGRAGLRLLDVLSGRMAPEEVVPHDLDAAAIGPFGGEPGLAPRLTAVLGDLARAIGARLGVGRRPRVLELLGAAPEAKSLVASLDAGSCDLVVAAPTRERCAGLTGLLRANPGIQVCVIDPAAVAQGPAGLGGRFDLVVLGSGLTGGDPDRLLGQVQAIIAQDGILVTVEPYPTRVRDLCFGLDPGWWSNGTDAPTRSRPRLPDGWRGPLARHGLTDTAVVLDTPQGPGSHYLILARAVGRPGVMGDRGPLGRETPRPWCLVADASPYAAALAEQLAAVLRARGEPVVRIGEAMADLEPAWDSGSAGMALKLDDATHWARFFDHLRAGPGGPGAVVNLIGLDPRPDGADAYRTLERQERRAAAMLASLQGCRMAGAAPDYWVVTARAGAGLLPAALREELGPLGAAADAPMWALARVSMNEFPELHLRWVDLAEAVEPREAAGLLADELLEPDAEDEVILASRGRFATRARVLGQNHPAPMTEPVAQPRLEPCPGRRTYLDFSAPGPLKNLMWRRDDPPPLGDGEVEIAVRAAGLNFRDVMYAMGLLPDEALEGGFSGPTLGMELAGVVTAVGAGVSETRVGEEVIAFAPAAFADRVVTRASAVVPKPEGWSFAAGATISTAFFTAYYAIKELAHLTEGERILIHGAAGGVGLAALQIARHLGAEIFATAGTPEKRDIVRMLGADHVLDSRSLAFADDILALTDGCGVDVVLNSLAGEAINRNLRVLRPFGRFLELGKRDFFENTRIGLRPLRNNIAYFGIDADQLLIQKPALARRVLLEVMALFAGNVLKPLPHRAFDAAEVVDAFRYMQHSRQVGKVVVTFEQDFAPQAACTGTGPALRLREDATYLVTGGLSGLGLRTAQWLAAKGARALVLLSRRGEGGEGAPQDVLAGLRAAGARVWAPACDVTDRAALADVLSRVEAELPPLRGVVHAAMVIDDAMLGNLTQAQLHRVLAPKVLGALHLDALTRGMSLDFFVLYSSATTLFGNPGQGAYVAANMTLEGLAVDRRSRALPATCVAWGPIGDLGYLARHAEVKEALVTRLGGQALSADQVLAILEGLLVRDASNVAALDLAWGALERFLPTARAPKFSALAALGPEAAPAGEGADDLRDRLDGLEADALAAAVIDILKQELGAILRLSADQLDSDRSVYEMGMDSLMGAELITALDARLGIALPLVALSEGPTLARLAERIVHELRPAVPARADASGAADHARTVAQVAAQHGEVLEPELIEALSERLASGTSAAPVTRGGG